MHITLPTGIVEVVFLQRDDFFGDFTRSIVAPPRLHADFTSDEYSAEKRETEDLIRHGLAARWTEGDDFEVGWDENFAMTLCGGIYSPRIFCREYLEVLHGILRSTRHYHQWAYSTAIELSAPLDGITD